MFICYVTYGVLFMKSKIEKNTLLSTTKHNSSMTKKIFSLGKVFLFFAILLVAGLSLTACSMNQNGSHASSSGSHASSSHSSGVTFALPSSYSSEVSDLQSISSEEELENLFASSSTYYGGGLLRGGPMMLDAALPMAKGAEVAMAEPSNEVASGSEGSSDYSKTNNQVQGVDEADIIKNDGKYIYTISGNNLYIVDAYPAENATILSKIDFSSRPQNLFIDGDKLVVYGYENSKAFFDVLDYRPRNSMVFFKIYDVSDRTHPVLSKEMSFEGSALDARLLGDNVYLVVQNTPSFVGPYPRPIYFEGGLKADSVKQNSEGSSGSSEIPASSKGSERSSVLGDVVIHQVPLDKIHYLPQPYSYPRLVTVYDINLAKEKIADLDALTVEGSPTLYMSKDNLYLLSSQHISEWELRQDLTVELLRDNLSSEEKNLIDRINNVDSDILSSQEKKSKILNVYYQKIDRFSSAENKAWDEKLDSALEKKIKELKYLDFTIIMKLHASGDHLELSATNKVPGTLHDQFSADENDGYLRLATTIPRRWSSLNQEQTTSKNAVFVLNNDLELVGSLENLAENEQIYSARFMGDRLYLVTYKQVDPFFVIDLSVPKKPKVLGSLKLPGFSRYLHPYDKNHIIGLGSETTSSGRTQGLKISLFDVSDVQHPVEVAKFVTNERYASSTAFYEHHAFLFSKEKELLVIPAFNRDYRYDGVDEQSYNGAFVFHINESDITLRGLIDHSSASNTQYWGPVVERSLYIDNMLYTKSPSLLRINALDDLHAVKNISLSTQKEDIPVY